MLKRGITTGHVPERAELDSLGIGPVRLALAKMVGTALGAGYVGAAQGTVGSLWPVALYYLAPAAWLDVSPLMTSGVMLLCAAVTYAAGVWAAEVLEHVWGSDPGRVVIDEVAGMFLTLAFVPLTSLTVWAGFVLFRIFDILKPPPIRALERRGGGWGVMNDDMLAGLYAGVLLRLLLHVTG
jgi:phosphatidylglycerophosphatase A